MHFVAPRMMNSGGIPTSPHDRQRACQRGIARVGQQKTPPTIPQGDQSGKEFRHSPEAATQNLRLFRVMQAAERAVELVWQRARRGRVPARHGR